MWYIGNRIQYNMESDLYLQDFQLERKVLRKLQHDIVLARNATSTQKRLST